MTPGSNEPIAEYHQVVPGAGKRQMKDIQAIKKILGDCSFFDGASRQAIRGRDNADCHGHTCSGSDPTHLSFFQDSQKLCLNLRRHLGNFLESQLKGTITMKLSRIVVGLGLLIASLHLIRTASSRRMKPGGLPCLERTSSQSSADPTTLTLVPVAMLPTFREEADGSSKTDVVRTV
jgi:hypothetical protein